MLRGLRPRPAQHADTWTETARRRGGWATDVTASPLLPREQPLAFLGYGTRNCHGLLPAAQRAARCSLRAACAVTVPDVRPEQLVPE